MVKQIKLGRRTTRPNTTKRPADGPIDYHRARMWPETSELFRQILVLETAKNVGDPRKIDMIEIYHRCAKRVLEVGLGS